MDNAIEAESVRLSEDIIDSCVDKVQAIQTTIDGLQQQHAALPPLPSTTPQKLRASELLYTKKEDNLSPTIDAAAVRLPIKTESTHSLTAFFSSTVDQRTMPPFISDGKNIDYYSPFNKPTSKHLENNNWTTLFLLFPMCFAGLILSVSHQVLELVTNLIEKWMHDLWHEISPPTTAELQQPQQQSNLFQTIFDENSLWIGILGQQQAQCCRHMLDVLQRNMPFVRMMLVVAFLGLLSMYIGLWMALQMNNVLLNGLPAERMTKWSQKIAMPLDLETTEHLFEADVERY